jgi:Periplasmic binding protein domain
MKCRNGGKDLACSRPCFRSRAELVVTSGPCLILVAAWTSKLLGFRRSSLAHESREELNQILGALKLRVLTERKPARAQKALRVGILHSLTGTMAWTESPVVDATLLAIEEINGRGGIQGREIRPAVIDEASDYRAFARHAETLIAQAKACTIFGGYFKALYGHNRGHSRFRTDSNGL